MNNLKVLMSFCFIVFLSGCMTVETVKDNNLAVLENQGYLALIFDTRDNLSTLKIRGRTSNLPNVKISYVTKGLHLFLYQLPAGDYCLKSFETGLVKWSIPGDGDCMNVEAGKINYPGHIVPTPDGNIYVNAPWKFFRLLNADYPLICKKHLLSLCQGELLKSENGNYDLAMNGLLESKVKTRKEAPKAGTRINIKNNAVNTKELH